ncbi:MAG: hypothetical protein JKX84_08530 [Flavobacteriales bacterium]|nr:hypothetical protein [Flavobacteriales bacterium]
MRRRNNLSIAFFLALILSIPFSSFAQDDLMDLLNDTEPAKQEKVIATFKTTRIIQAHTTETVKANTMDVRITHRFGNIYSTRNDNDGPDSFFGLDNIADVRLAVEYGITDELMIGLGRSSRSNLIDGFAKYRFYQQTTDNKRPFSLALFTNIGIRAQKEGAFYSGVKPELVAEYSSTKTFFHKISYTAQLIIARKFSPGLSIELLPTYIHRNFVNNPNDENSTFALGVGGRVKVSKRVAIIADFFYVFSPFRYNNTTNPFYMPISIGVEIETGGHVFHLEFTNAQGVVSNNFLVDSPHSWEFAEFKLGFNISRVFNVGRRLKKAKEKVEG